MDPGLLTRRETSKGNQDRKEYTVKETSNIWERGGRSTNHLTFLKLDVSDYTP
jgi:hypothetical protein